MEKTIESGRKTRLKLNTVWSLTFQVTTIICGFIIPQLILRAFGSEINGLVNSITQMLQIIAFLELGVGAVVQSSLYKPLSQNDNDSCSRIIRSASRFFRKIAIVLTVYVCILVFLYPRLINANYDFIFTATLILAMSISSFARYYFGVVDKLLLNADQHGYVQYIIETSTLVLNTIACIILIKMGASIQLVKLTTSIIYLLRPVFLRLYVRKHYSVNRKIEYEEEPIKQKWNGVAQHVAAIVLDSTDNIVLTVFSTLKNVSIYSVYYLVVFGVRQLFISLMSGAQSLMGELYARDEQDNLEHFFSRIEWGVHTGVTFLFGCTGVLIVPFIMVYTSGITDANYNQPLFATLLTVAYASYCLRLPYNMLILAAGHYKQTQHCFIIAASINIIVSIATVKLFGLIGVAVGTLVAMLYQTLWMMRYDFKNLIRRSYKLFIKQVSIDVLTVLISLGMTSFLQLEVVSYLEWITLAFKVVSIVAFAVIVINLIFYRTNMLFIFRKFSRNA